MIVVLTARPRRLSPRRCSHSTAGLRASAKKRAIKTHVSTSRAIQTSCSIPHTEIATASTVRIVRTGNRTSVTGAGSRSGRTAMR